MIITAKATQPQTQSRPADPAEAYVLKNAYEKSKAPYAFFLVLMGVGLYLKSIFPGWSRTIKEADAAPEEADKGQPQVAELDPAIGQPEGEEDMTTGTPGVDQGQGAFSGGTLVALQPSAKFALIDSPRANFFAPAADPDAFTLVEPYRQTLRATNDNLSDFLAGGGGGSSGVMPSPREDSDTGPEDPGPNDPGPDDPDENDDDDDDDDDDQEVANRAPRVAGPVHLYDITACAILAIGLLDLLRGASDPDGDGLQIAGLSASSGTLAATSFGWTFQPAPFAPGPVTLTYTITDGALSVAQTAHFTVLARGWVEGSEGDDTLTGSQCADDIEGGSGHDLIDGRAGNDVIAGGAGDDHILAGDGDDTVFAGSGNDIVLAGRGNDLVFGGAGDDRLFGEEGDDILHGEDGDDFLSGGTGRDMLYGGAGDDVLQGDDGDDYLDGGYGHDRIDGGAGNDILSDGDGADLVMGGTGDDVVFAAMDGADDVYDGGCDYDTVEASISELKFAMETEHATCELGSPGGDATGVQPSREAGDVLDYSAANETLLIDLVDDRASGIEIGYDTIIGFETVIAGSGDDHFVVGPTAVSLYGGAGENLFEFRGPGEEAARQLVFDIHDFKAGDRVRMDKYDLFERVFDDLEDQFEKVYGDKVDEEDFAVRTRIEEVDGYTRTLIEADFNRDDTYETTVVIDGRYVLAIVETA